MFLSREEWRIISPEMTDEEITEWTKIRRRTWAPFVKMIDAQDDGALAIDIDPARLNLGPDRILDRLPYPGALVAAHRLEEDGFGPGLIQLMARGLAAHLEEVAKTQECPI